MPQSITLSPDTLRFAEAAAAIEGIPLAQWIERAVRCVAQADLEYAAEEVGKAQS